jgi:hypothetical protein
MAIMRATLLSPEATTVERGAQHCAHLVRAEHDGQHARLVDAQEIEHGPVPMQRVDEEEAQRVHRDIDARGRELLVLAQV